LPRLGIVQLLDLEVNAGDLLHAVDIVRILGKHLLKDVDGLLRGLEVVRRIQSGHDVLGQRGSQVALGHGQRWIQLRSFWKWSMASS